jgi:hypothetical protein
MKHRMVVAVGLMSVLASCGSNQDRVAEPKGEVAPVETVAIVAPGRVDVADRADRYGDEVAAGRPPVEMELNRRLRAAELQTVECLVDAGFERLPVAPAPRGDGPDIWFGPDDPFAVAQEQADAIDAIGWPDDPELQRALAGDSSEEYPLVGPDGRSFGSVLVETGGCRGTSILAEFGSVARYVEVSQSIHLESEVISAAFGELMGDPEYLELQRKLERCMEKAGWPELDRDLLWKDQRASAAWAECRARLQYLGTASALFSDAVAEAVLASDAAAIILDG